MCIEMYKNCRLCARACGVDRTAGRLGYCASGAVPTVARAALHMWEEPVISGERGSGTIFFSGCSLRCTYCQNRVISRAECGTRYTEAELCELMLDLWRQGAHNINLVTPTHFVPSVIRAVRLARERGLHLPIVYNTGSYDTVQTIKSLHGTVDIYLPDFKYYRVATAKRLSAAADYPTVAYEAISEMVRQVPSSVVENGIMTRGVIVRFLLLPGHVAEAKLALRRIYDSFGNNIFYSLMSQYTPMEGMPRPLDRRVTVSEYGELVNYAERLGIVNGFTQERSSAVENYIPDFEC